MVSHYAIEEFLADVGCCRDSPFGQRFRNQFRDTRGSAELAMLAAPSEQEYKDFCEVVKVLTEEQKHNIEKLTGKELLEIAQQAGADPGNTAIFINGFIIEKKKRTQHHPQEG